MKRAWWKEAVVYQIYPRSFYDSDGDGIGDLKGIIQKLDYLKDLGIDVIWLNPVYKSPNDDNGYDISDYQDIMDEFGTLHDFEELLDQVHKRGMKLIMDLVVNHTSDEHPWFIESRSSKDNARRDYYIWRDGDGKCEPNNWGSFFSPSAWEWDEKTCQYYLHLFSRKQPDLNWENPGVRKEVYTMMKWWLDKGIDGFRMDVINAVSKAKGLPDAPKAKGDKKKYVLCSDLIFNQPGTHEILQEMNREVLCKYDIMTVGETGCVTTEDGLLYTSEDRNELNMVFQFEHMDLDSGPGGKWDVVRWKLPELKKVMDKWQLGLQDKGWNSLYLNNHDQPRMVSHFGNDGRYREESAKLLATFLHTLKGTPFIYQGEEIGMTNVRFETIDFYRDIETLNMYREAVEENKMDRRKVMEAIHAKSRDNARTPMQWNDSENAGFTTGNPWINVNPNYRDINVEKTEKDEDSVLNYYKKLIKLRKEHQAMVYADYMSILTSDEHIYSYIRTLGSVRLLVILNFSDKAPVFRLPDGIDFEKKELLISNYETDHEEDIKIFRLKPYEARVYILK